MPSTGHNVASPSDKKDAPRKNWMCNSQTHAYHLHSHSCFQKILCQFPLRTELPYSGRCPVSASQFLQRNTIRSVSVFLFLLFVPSFFSSFPFLRNLLSGSGVCLWETGWESERARPLMECSHHFARPTLRSDGRQCVWTLLNPCDREGGKFGGKGINSFKAQSTVMKDIIWIPEGMLEETDLYFLVEILANVYESDSFCV